MSVRFAVLLASTMLASQSVNALTVSGNVTDNGVYDLLSGPHYLGLVFEGGDAAGSMSFTFENSSTSATLDGVSIGPVFQFTGSLGGFTAGWQNGESRYVAPGGYFGALDFMALSSTLDVGGSDVFTVSWNDVTGTSARVNLAFIAGTLTPVPLDATPPVSSVPLPSSLPLALGALFLGGTILRPRKQP